mmetsp:Transcript_18328/g.62277  ORF Transcript_18328/g.62277 Transcript_18328/m.62277 type:complete len:264 (-) Transcript_18328:4093-4884(-)
MGPRRHAPRGGAPDLRRGPAVADRQRPAHPRGRGGHRVRLPCERGEHGVGPLVHARAFVGVPEVRGEAQVCAARHPDARLRALRGAPADGILRGRPLPAGGRRGHDEDDCDQHLPQALQPGGGDVQVHHLFVAHHPEHLPVRHRGVRGQAQRQELRAAGRQEDGCVRGRSVHALNERVGRPGHERGGAPAVRAGRHVRAGEAYRRPALHRGHVLRRCHVHPGRRQERHPQPHEAPHVHLQRAPARGGVHPGHLRHARCRPLRP